MDTLINLEKFSEENSSWSLLVFNMSALTLREVSVFGVILVRIFPHSGFAFRIRENTDQKNSEYGHFLLSVIL